jgi:choice-of-anchor A domain-containing protein
MKASRFLAVILVFLYGASSQASELSLGAASNFNVFTFSDFFGSGTDAQGRVAVGGNFAPASNGSFTVASGLHDGAGTYDLVVGGNYTNVNTAMNSGDAYVGGNMTWTDPTLGHNAYVAGSFTNNSGGGSVGGTIYYGGSFSSGDSLTHSKVSPGSITSPINFASAQSSLTALSAALAGETANGTVSHASSTYTLTGTDANLNIFDLTNSSYSAATINISAPAGSTVIINVPGSAASFTYGSINLSGISANNVIWNFNNATSLALNGIGFNGTILAPGAAFSGTWGDIDGQLIANTVTGTTEFHDYLFSGNLGTVNNSQNDPSAAPEPGTWVLLAIGGLLFTIRFWNPRRAGLIPAEA